MPAQIRIAVPPGLNTASDAVTEELAKGLSDAGLTVQRQAKSLAPVSTGNLRRSISSTVAPIAGRPAAIVSASAAYATFVEYGRAAHTPLFAQIQRWASRKGLPAGAIWMAIRRRGTKPHPFMVPALEQKKQAVIDRLQQALAAAVKRMTG